MTGHFAANVWKHFADFCGISREYLPLHSYIMRWWDTEYKNEAHKLVLHSIPIFICWNLWKNRCAGMYAGKKSNLARVKYLIYKDCILLMNTVYPYIPWPACWKDLILTVDKCVHDIKITPVKWLKPASQWVKLNSDGSSLTDGSMGAGGIIRNNEGKFLFAYATPLGDGSNNKAEVEAAVFGIDWCIQLGYTKVILEVDSELLYKWVNQLSNSPWHMTK